MENQFAQVPPTNMLRESVTNIGLEKTLFLPLGRHTPKAHAGTVLGDNMPTFNRVERSVSSLDELRADPKFGRLWQVPQEPRRDPVEQAQEHRLAILARKYEGTELTREDVARVAILTQRLRRLVPRVTAKSWTIAEESVNELEILATNVDEIRLKYGL